MGLKDLSVEGFVQALSTKEPTPGGGSAAASTGAMGVGLLLMVSHFLEETPAMSAHMAELDSVKKQLVYLIDEDAKSFNGYMDAIHLPKNNDEEKPTDLDGIVAHHADGLWTNAQAQYRPCVD